MSCYGVLGMLAESLIGRIRLSLAPLKIHAQNRTTGLICPFLPPRIVVKSQPIKKMVGRGGGDRTHDLRLKRPLLYH
jgi:hypothetical protein